MTTSRERPSYGVDGYPFLAGLLTASALGAAAAVAAWYAGRSGLAAAVGTLALLPSIPAALGLHYVVRGKFRHRDRLLAAVPWRGDEVVLDVGTGAGLMLLGAAKRAPRGRCIGIDIWRVGDLSSNGRQRTFRNAELEGVRERIEVRDEDARTLTGPDGSVDVVLSTLCLHNIEENRDAALTRIAAILRPGGWAVLSDLAHVEDYARILEAHGFRVSQHGPAADTFPPQRWLVARKAGESAEG